MKIQHGHSIEDYGLIFVYRGDAIDVMQHGGKVIHSFDVEQDRINTEVDFQQEIAWYGYNNNLQSL